MDKEAIARVNKALAIPYTGVISKGTTFCEEPFVTVREADLRAILALQSSEGERLREAVRASLEQNLGVGLVDARARSLIIANALAAFDATLSPAEPSPESREGWQPIETAPKDGTEFLSAGGVNGTEGKAYSTRYLSPGPYSTENGKNTEGERRYQWPDGFYWAGYDGFVGPVDPTIWRPLPAPPASEIRALSAPAHD